MNQNRLTTNFGENTTFCFDFRNSGHVMTIFFWIRICRLVGPARGRDGEIWSEIKFCEKFEYTHQKL